MRPVRKNTRARLMLSAAGVALALSANAAFAQDVRFDIAPQSLSTALYEFGAKSGRQVMFTPDVTATKTTAGVSGVWSELAALDHLLDGTGLTYRVNGSTVIVTGAADPQSGSAAGDGADQGTVQALIVTAQKREEDIQDVPIAISAFTQEDLTRSQVAGGSDLMTQVPNMTFTKTNFSSYSIQIRGIGTQAISATVDPAVAVAFNNTPFVRNHFFEQEFYDLQRVEVLRGPQGTLYGRNATAGVVNIISARPKFRFEAKLSADVANYGSHRLEGMVNIPLVDDRVALRLAGAWTKRDGFVTNQLTGDQIDGRDLWSGRVTLGFEPSDRVRAYLVYEHFEEDDDRLRSGKQLCKTHPNPTQFDGYPVSTGVGSPFPNRAFTTQGCLPASLYAAESFQVTNGFALPYYAPLYAAGVPFFQNFDPYVGTTQSRDLRVIESQLAPEYKARNDLAELQVQVDLTSSLTLTSETAYSRDQLFSFEDYNRFNTAPGIFDPDRNPTLWLDRGVLYINEQGNAAFCDPQLGCSDRLLAGDVSTAKSSQFSQELRLSSDFDGPLNFGFGANFLRYDTVDKYYVFANTLSLYTTLPDFSNRGIRPYVPGVYDGSYCSGRETSDPTAQYQALWCHYMDPNSIHSLNDLGRNYFLSKNPYRLISYAVFGELTYQITSDLKLTGGLRWTVDKKHAPIVPSWLLAGRSYGLPVLKIIEQEWREPTGRLVIDWKPDLSFTDETLLYASYAHGYKAGGANPPLPVDAFLALTEGEGIYDLIAAGRADTFGPEFVDAFEIGTKNTLAGGALTLNANAFYYDYTGYQISQIVNRSATNFNFDAEVWGAELELDWRPMDNLRLGLKGGYEKTRMADGSSAIDMIDRTAGHTDWAVIKPFPTVPSNCILPTYVLGAIAQLYSGDFANGISVACEDAYVNGLDPLTGLPYVPDPTEVSTLGNHRGIPPGYRGFNPLTAPNGGAGFSKDLSGNELPNAPHFTGTLTADYTLPLPHDWLMTLHTDLYYQSEAWTRVFNMEGYDKLKAYTNVNFAAIFTNEDAGWNVMAYVKNVLDKDNITGAFLNSDDTGLTTNVFLNEPRLYGLRVTKQWTGAPWWQAGAHTPGEPWPFTVELGGQVQRHDTPKTAFAPGFISAFSDVINPVPTQAEDLDRGDGREVKLTYRPQGSPWTLSAAARFGKTNGTASLSRRENLDSVCLVGPPFEALCSNPKYRFTPHTYSETEVSSREDHTIVDLKIGRDFGLGMLGGVSKFSFGLGLRYAQLTSDSRISLWGRPDVTVPSEWAAVKYSQSHQYDGDLSASREFSGAGPVVSWDASRTLLGDEDHGHVDVDWNIGGGVLFGKQRASLDQKIDGAYYNMQYFQISGNLPTSSYSTLDSFHRSKSVTVPNISASLGLSYEIQRLKVSGGYRIEKFYNVIDGGYSEHKSYDRTIDGPYFKIAVGFGG